jgi:hypothetical protein
MPKLRVLGDVHQRYELYLPCLENVDYSIQVGDLGMDYTDLNQAGIDTTRHRAIGGNHDVYEHDSPNYFKKHPIFLEDFGLHEIPGFPPIFYVRGAWSIDHMWRKKHQGYPYNKKNPPIWWVEEELSADQFEVATELYAQTKPEFVITHEGILELVPYVTDPSFAENFGYSSDGPIETRTNKALQAMFDIHQPRHWICGHYHFPWTDTVKGTKFIYLDMFRSNMFWGEYENCYVDFDENLNLIGPENGFATNV